MGEIPTPGAMISRSSFFTPHPISYDARPETRAFWRSKLPHWDVLGRPIFLMLHVSGAIPRDAMRRIRADAADLCDHRTTDYTRKLKLIFKNMEAWLDRVDHVDCLRSPDVAIMLREAIERRAADGAWRPLHWVAMPSHLHILYVGGRIGMKRLISDFKRWTGRQANALLARVGETFWQDEWFDHWSRSADETDRIAHYIHQNPVRAGLVSDGADWPYASWSNSSVDT